MPEFCTCRHGDVRRKQVETGLRADIGLPDCLKCANTGEVQPERFVLVGVTDTLEGRLGHIHTFVLESTRTGEQRSCLVAREGMTTGEVWDAGTPIGEA